MKGPVNQHLDEIRNRIDMAQSLVIFLDFDGTLAPIADHPDQVYLDPGSRQSLLSLSACPDVTLAVISGRKLSDLQMRVDVAGIVYAGNHGLEISGPECAFVEPVALEQRVLLKELLIDLAKRLRDVPGAWVEDKDLTASVHFRGVAQEQEETVRQLVHCSLANASHPFFLTPGDKVFEIRPRVYWNKGNAANWIRAHAAEPNSLALYLGDDATDEDAFAALADDITIKVGAVSESLAHFHLINTEEVREFLRWLIDEHLTAHLLCDGR